MAEVNRTYVHFPGSSRAPAGRKKYAECLPWHLLEMNWVTCLFSPFHFFHFKKIGFTRPCVSAVSMLCVCLHSIPTPWSRFRHRHILHLSLSPPRHLNFLQSSFTSVPWRTDTSSPLSSVPVCHSSPAPIAFCLSACLLSAVYTLFIVSSLLHFNPGGVSKSYNAVNSFGIELGLLRVINFLL